VWIAKIGYIVISVISCLIGLGLILYPQISVSLIGKFFGVAMIVFGIIKLIGYFSKDLYRLAFQYDLEFGILSLALGIIALFKSENVLNFLCIAFGIVIFADALFKIRISMDAKRFGITSWWLILLWAVLTGAIGLFLIFKPVESVQAVTVFLGISLLVEGALNLCLSIITVKIAYNQKPDIVEGEFQDRSDEL
jgi:uncharacterized membrane protein HdeD (DUF308 family)